MSMTNKTIAVIMSVYRNDRLCYVQPAVESLLAQTYETMDIYIRADGPVKDEVANYLQTIEDDRLHYSVRSTNCGLAHTMNELLQMILPMGYQYIARMDADDISLPQRFEKQIKYMNSHPDIDCLGTWATEITADGQKYYDKQMPQSHEECLQLFHQRDCIIHPTAMFRPRYFEKAGLYDTTTYFAEDTMLWTAGFEHGCVFGNLPEYLYLFRLDDQFFERRRGWKHARSIFRLRCAINHRLGFGPMSYIYAMAYASAKMMPTGILNKIYQHNRNIPNSKL